MAEDVISYNTLLHDGMSIDLSIGVLIKKRAIYNIVSKILKIHCQIYLVISTEQSSNLLRTNSPEGSMFVVIWYIIIKVAIWIYILKVSSDIYR